VSAFEAAATVIGLAIITLVTRSLFFMTEREWVLPGWVARGLRYAPLAALAAVVVPEIFMTDGHFLRTWQDARLYAAAAATLYFLWRRGILGTIVVGMAVLVPMKIFLGW
jgi:branched-subunit amino acid transport protein